MSEVIKENEELSRRNTKKKKLTQRHNTVIKEINQKTLKKYPVTVLDEDYMIYKKQRIEVKQIVKKFKRESWESLSVGIEKKGEDVGKMLHRMVKKSQTRKISRGEMGKVQKRKNFKKKIGIQ